jgi:predicted phage terminase large subunit-like protein
MTAGSIKRLALSIPPQHGKSSLVTERYTVYRLAKNPRLRIGIGSYNQSFANRFGRHTRRIAEAAGIQISNESKSMSEWETAQGGGIVCVGVGAGVTGRPIDLLIIDDPVKSRAEADSAVYRERVWEWWTEDLYTRLQQDATAILIQTRWHSDDLWGRIMAGESGCDWTAINLPAEAEDDDPLGRAVGEALCPERFDLASLKDKHLVLGSYGYNALYQGRPSPREGGYIKRHWFGVVEARPANATVRVRYWDLAATTTGDYSVGVLMSKCPDGSYCIEDVQRDRLSSLHTERLVSQTANVDGRGVKIYIEQEGGSGGLNTISNYTRLLSGYSVRGDKPTGSKEIRSDPFAAQAEAGNISMVRGAWNSAYLDELGQFPTGTNDDQVDASSGAFNRLTSEKRITAAGRI